MITTSLCNLNLIHIFIHILFIYQLHKMIVVIIVYTSKQEIKHCETY